MATNEAPHPFHSTTAKSTGKLNVCPLNRFSGSINNLGRTIAMQVSTPGTPSLKPGGRESSQRRVGLTSQSSRTERMKAPMKFSAAFTQN